ncbi:MAG TPA: DUF1761 domain-containing protein [Candidatus Nanoarchaeia archaeon]|nr:DUF1761 domain-containing protein [Candidatus Nanoarchaeia archaeon]
MGNLVEILAVAAIVFAIGWLWYSPVLFGNMWLKITKMKKPSKNAMKGMWKYMLTGYISTAVMVFITNLFVNSLYVTTFAAGAQLGAVAWLGFVATEQLSMVLWDRKPVKLYLINTAHNLVAMAVAGGILAIWA